MGGEAFAYADNNPVVATMRSTPLFLIVTVCLAVLPSAGTVVAQERGNSLVPDGWSVRQVHVKGGAIGSARKPRHSEQVLRTADDVVAARPLTARPLTVQRYFPPSDDLEVFNHISIFDPVPSVDSGVQLPYGLDGVGGYGSDFGFSAGSDGALYDRGP